MEVTIEAYADAYTVLVNGKVIGFWTYLGGAIEAARKEILARYPLPHIKK
jgi:hypothetical protein